MLPPGAQLDTPPPLAAALAEAGRSHEQRVIDHLCTLISASYQLSSNPLCTIPFAHPNRHDLTQDAMERHVPLIRGAALKDNLLDGYADLLILSKYDPFLSPSQRESAHPSSYSVCEIKLAANQRTDHTLQAAVYASLLERLLKSRQIPPSSLAYLCLGPPSTPPVRLPTRTLHYFFRTTSTAFSRFLADFDPEHLPPPDGSLEEMAPWKEFATKLLEDSDSLRLVAGIRQKQVSAITAATGLTTLEHFAALPSQRVESLCESGAIPAACLSLHQQAALQLKARSLSDESIPFEFSKASFQSLPNASPLDMYFDMEGFPLFHNGGLEYLFGVHFSDDRDFQFWWAHTRAEEEEAFISFVRALCDTVKMTTTNSQTRPHVYHYGHYEIAALRRIGLRAKTNEGMRAAFDLELLMENGLFVDIYKFVRSVLVVGARSYSIKTIEKLVNVSREGDDLADAESSVAMYYEWRRSNFDDPNDPNEKIFGSSSQDILEDILDYNKQDCESLERVVDWLREQLGSPDAQRETKEIVDGNREEDVRGDTFQPGSCGRTKELKLADSNSILASIVLSEDLLRKRSPHLTKDAACALSHILQFYARESAPSRRIFRERIKAAATKPQTLWDDEKCIVGINLTDKLAISEQSIGNFLSYSFRSGQPVQYTDGESVAFVRPRKDLGINEDGELSNEISCFLRVKGVHFHPGSKKGSVIMSAGKKEMSMPPRFGTTVSTEDLTICDAPLRQSVLRRALDIMHDKTPMRSALAVSFLNRYTVDENEDERETWEKIFGASTVATEDVSRFLSSRQSPRVFVIQGPPGSGKTYLSSHLIQDLVKNHEKTVAVSSNSHSAIDNLLEGVVKAGIDSQIVYKIGTRSVGESDVRFKANIDDVNVSARAAREVVSCVNEVDSSAKEGRPKRGRSPKKSKPAAVVGATCYQLCREENDGKFDFVFIDEASQMTMAHFVALSSCAKYAILVGDQQQLEMPIRGGHPIEVGQSCLSYMVGRDVATVPPSRGIFLRKSYRMNPQLCQFVSDEFYEGELKSLDACADNAVHVDDRIEPKELQIGGGICFIPCETVKDDEEGRKRFGKWSRPGEVELVRRCVEALLGNEFTTRHGTRRLQEDDILVMAPYNAQVRALREVLPDGIRVGTVDKFQGLEAAVALISTCTTGSEGDDELCEMDGEELDATSSGSSSHRSLRFCLRGNRLNVAVSRAQCLAVVTGDARAEQKLQLRSVDDIRMAALYEHLRAVGSASSCGQA